MAKKPLYILGLCYFGQHDSAAALLKDGALVAMQGSADRSFPLAAVQHCLRAAGITIDNIDHAAFFWQPWRGIGPRVWYALRGLPSSLTRGTKNAGVLLDLLSAQRVFRRKTGYRGPFQYVDHTLAHAAHAFYTSGFEKAAILTADGTGETKTCWLGEASGTQFTEHQSVRWPHSLGHTYSAVTEYLGFESFKDESKVMELSTQGTPSYLDKFRHIIKSTQGGLFEIDLRYMNYQYSREPRYSPLFAREFVNARPQDIAASLQARLEEVVLDMASYTIKKSGCKNLCLAGGVMHNTLAVEKLRQSGIAEKVFVPAQPGDAGTALGAALHTHHDAS